MRPLPFAFAHARPKAAAKDDNIDVRFEDYPSFALRLATTIRQAQPLPETAVAEGLLRLAQASRAAGPEPPQFDAFAAATFWEAAIAGLREQLLATAGETAGRGSALRTGDGRLIDGLLAGLPAGQSEVLKLAAERHLPAVEIAVIVGMPVPEVRRLLRAALQGLAAQLPEARGG